VLRRSARPGRHACPVRTIRIPALAITATVALSVAACGSPANPAERVAATILAVLAPVHPRVVCDNGDGGTGIDNDVPWFTVYLVVDRTPDLDRTVTDAAAKAGLRLEPDLTRTTRAAQAAASHSAGSPRRGPDAPVLEPVPAVPSTSFLAADGSGRKLDVAVARTGQMSTRCRKTDQSGATPVEPGKAAMIIDVELAAR
jgi:hypothetical protein